MELRWMKRYYEIVSPDDRWQHNDICRNQQDDYLIRERNCHHHVLLIDD